MFGCSPSGGGSKDVLIEQVLPRMLAEAWPAFSFKNCRFAMEKVCLQQKFIL
jgi:hypothetical protein